MSAGGRGGGWWGGRSSGARVGVRRERVDSWRALLLEDDSPPAVDCEAVVEAA